MLKIDNVNKLMKKTDKVVVLNAGHYKHNNLFGKMSTGPQKNHNRLLELL